jgi:hypothetical protein
MSKRGIFLVEMYCESTKLGYFLKLNVKYGHNSWKQIGVKQDQNNVVLMVSDSTYNNYRKEQKIIFFLFLK